MSGDFDDSLATRRALVKHIHDTLLAGWGDDDGVAALVVVGRTDEQDIVFNLGVGEGWGGIALDGLFWGCVHIYVAGHIGDGTGSVNVGHLSFSTSSMAKSLSLGHG